MKRLILLFLYGISGLVLVSGLLLVSPYYFYNKIINQQHSSEWFNLNSFSPTLLNPNPKITLKEPNLGNDDLWRSFHIKDTFIPLPYKNPFYFIAPILKYDPIKKFTNFGVSVYGTSDLEISKVFFVNNRVIPSVIRSQNIFKLPLATDILKSIPFEKIWKDVFSLNLNVWEVPYSELLYRLYILQLRTVILPEKFKTFSLLNDDTGVVELFSTDKDYKSELILTKQRGLIYSFLIVTDLNNNESQVLRYKYLKEISFRPSSEALSGIIYKEFKALEYKYQVGQIGMMYLLSAYSHSMDVAYLKEMIKYLERGEKNQTSLKRLYEYAQKRYGETFANSIIKGVELEDELSLKRNIEIEDRERLRQLSEKAKKVEATQKSEEELFNDRIEKAKTNKKIRENRMIID